MKLSITTNIILLTLSLSTAIASEDVRTWTNTEGRSIQAKLIGFDGNNVELLVGNKNYTLAEDTLSQADRDYLKAYAKTNTVKPKADSAKPKTGTFTMPLSAKMFSDPEDYYDTKIGKPTKRALLDEDVDPLPIVSYLPKDEQAKVYVPSSYDGSSPYAVYININSAGGPSCPNNYQPIMDRHNMIMASPYGAGNKEQPMRRIALALDTLASLQQTYKIDSAKVYVGGLSGGGVTALEAQLIYPDIWQGAFSHARGMGIGAYSDIYYSETKSFDQSDFERASRMKQRIAILSGPKDFNYDHCKETVKVWDDHGFNIEFFDTGKGHIMATPESFEEALIWVIRN